MSFFERRCVSMSIVSKLWQRVYMSFCHRRSVCLYVTEGVYVFM